MSSRGHTGGVWSAEPRHLAPRVRGGSLSAVREGSALDRIWNRVRFPLGVWAAWRALHLILLVLFNGDVVDATFYFDGGWFRTILDHGYLVTDPSYQTQQNPAFMPGVAWLTWPLAQLLGAELAAWLVANATGAAAFCAVYIATRSWSGEHAARAVTVALALWPTSLVLWAYYSEGLFIVATALGLWADRTERPTAALLGCVLAPLTRTIGAGFGPVLALARWWRIGRVDLVGASYVLGSATATTAVTAVQQAQTGDAFAWVHTQDAWGRQLAPPWSPVVGAVADVLEKLPRPAMELSINLAAVALLAAAVTVLAVRWWRGRFPLSVTAWTAAAWLAPLCSAVISSQVRFALGAWPALVVVSFNGRWARTARAAGIVVGIGLSVVFVHRWANNTWVA